MRISSNLKCCVDTFEEGKLVLSEKREGEEGASGRESALVI